MFIDPVPWLLDSVSRLDRANLFMCIKKKRDDERMLRRRGEERRGWGEGEGKVKYAKVGSTILLRVAYGWIQSKLGIGSVDFALEQEKLVFQITEHLPTLRHGLLHERFQFVVRRQCEELFVYRFHERIARNFLARMDFCQQNMCALCYGLLVDLSTA